MQIREVIRSLTFRYIVQYVTVLSATVFLFLGLFYLYFSYTSFRDLGTSVLEEVETLQLVYRGQSLEGVNQYLADQANTPAQFRFHYLVTNAVGEKLAGDLPVASRYQEFDDGWLGFEMAVQDWDGSIQAEFLARSMELGDGFSAIVARDYVEIVQRAQLVFSTLFRVLIVTILLGVIGGFFSAANALKRVEKLNQDISRIIRGDPRARLNIDNEKGYIAALAAVVNQMLEQMESLMQGVRRVSDNIAHDLRTPLTRLRNDLSQLRERTEGADAVPLERIIDECDNLLASFNASLRISTLETGSRLAEGHTVDLVSLLRDVVELYEPLAQEREIQISFDANEPALCRAEADLLFQMFANVLDNAVKYTPTGGTISVQLRPHLAGGGQEGTSIMIADSGPGIPAVERKNVFRRFYRVESSRSEQPGHGLGLSLVQAIAHFHHGSVELSSNNPGLRVRIRLPRLD